MDWGQLLSADMPKATTIAAAAVSVLAAIGTAIMSYVSSRALEQKKARLQIELEGRKAELQSQLEGRKSDLQKDLEIFKAGICGQPPPQDARREYEYDARKRLYQQVEPLLFQLLEATENAFHAVSSLVRTQRMGDLPDWLSATAHKYYIRSIMHRLFCPLAIFRLIQRSTTLVDLNLDPSIRLRYAILKEAYLTWTDHFGLAKLAPELPYKPHEDDWATRRTTDPATYWLQGILIGNLDRLVDTMAVAEGGSFRSMNFGEWETAVDVNGPLHVIYEICEDIFVSFDFRSRPILGRLLIGYAAIMYVLNFVSRSSDDRVDFARMFSAMAASADIGPLLRWWNPTDPDVYAIVQPYVLNRLRQAETGGLARF